MRALGVAAAAFVALLVLVVFGSVNDPEVPDAGPGNCLPDMPGPARGGIVAPLTEGAYELTSGFGPRWGSAHQGLDMAAPIGTPIHAAADGTVRDAGNASGFGQWVVIDHPQRAVATVYGHVDTFSVHAGQSVRAGDVIATVGNRGESTGPHLHFEVWEGTQGSGTAVDPAPWLGDATPPGPVDLVAAVTPGVGCGVAPGGAGLIPGSVPAVYERWILEAGSICPEVTAPLVAAQIQQESGMREPNAGGDSVRIGSPAGAQGPSQFMPATWASEGRDGDGDGDTDIESIADAVVSQGHHDCELAGMMKQALAEGRVSGDLTELWLAAYNAGPGAVYDNRGVPPFAETQNYVQVIQRGAEKYAAVVPPSGSSAAVALAAARWDGAPYVWGGGDQSGPTQGGFDCSGLTLYAVAQATGGRVVLPHNTVDQLNDPRGQKIDPREMQPGDLVFPAGGNPGHVAIYAGDGQVWHAPTFGQAVTRAPLSAAVGDSFDVRRFM